ncbi:MAG: peptidoglycan DD-metalloendopeptidase family protein [Dokdonella sp.]
MIARHGFVAILTLACAFAVAQTPDPERQSQEKQAKQKLDQVRAQIKALVDQQRTTRGERDDATRTLREKDQAIAASALAVAATGRRLDDQQAELARLDDQKKTLETKLASQREALAALLRSAYALGRNEELKLLLQQDDVARIARVLAYHRYFQQARVEKIHGLLGDLKQLADVQQIIAAQSAELEKTRQAQAEDNRALADERAGRIKLLDDLDVQLKDQGARLAALGKDEKDMIELLERLRDVFADIPRQPSGAASFQSQRGQLAWPAKGRVLTAFGSSDESGRKSSGMRIAANSGTPVHAVARGRVVFADWFKGYGLLVIVDHGDNYLSLYGYNETLSKEVGDWVVPGEIIAGSGASGGQKESSVYFELRHKSEALDPRGWLAKTR